MPVTRDKTLPVYRIPWTKALTWLRSLRRDIHHSHAGFDGVYAIPQGGVFPATVLSVALDIPIVSDPFDVHKCLIVDDDVATGTTLNHHRIALNRDGCHAATIHTRPCPKIMPTFYGAWDEAPANHRLLWPWDYHATRPWGQTKTQPQSPETPGGLA